jgi:acyl-CoA thioester hydrolase
MYKHELKLRVRYGETDQMGYMYYGNYAQFYEVARVEMLRNLGLTYKGFEEDGVMMPVLELKCKYIKPAYYDDEILIKIIMKEIPSSRIQFFYELYNMKNELINLGETTLVFVDMRTKRPCRPPEHFLSKIKPYFSEIEK